MGSLGYTSLLDPGLDWGSSDFDIRQRLSIAPIWQTPWFAHSGAKAEREALGGWSISGIYTARGGVPFSVFDYTYDETFYTVPRLEPATPFSSHSVAKSPKPSGQPNLFYGLAIPASKAPGPYSSTLGISDFGPFPNDMMRRNSLRGPGAWGLDAALHKNFPIRERLGLEFSAEGINVLNHHNYYVNTTTLQRTRCSPYAEEERGGLGSTGHRRQPRRTPLRSVLAEDELLKRSWNSSIVSDKSGGGSFALRSRLPLTVWQTSSCKPRGSTIPPSPAHDLRRRREGSGKFPESEPLLSKIGISRLESTFFHIHSNLSAYSPHR